MSAPPLSAIGEHVDPVSSWTPGRDDPDSVFTYVDLSAVDQDAKVVSGARELACSEAPSRARQLIRAGDVLVSTVRPNLNGVALVASELDGATASTGFCVLRPRASQLDARYLYQWVKSPRFVSDMVRKATGASYPAVSDRIVCESKLPLPPLPEQRRIAEILDKADALRAKRRAALAQLDTLTQSIFLDMFGDPAANPKGWPIRTLNELGAEFRYGTSVKSSSAGEPTLRIPNVLGGSIDLADLKVVPVSEDEFERLRLRDGDLLFVRTNGNPNFVGRCAIFHSRDVGSSGHDADRFIYASYLIRARIANEVVEPVFLREYLLGAEGRRRLRARCKTSAGQYNINTEGLGAIAVPLPALGLQRAFSERIGAVVRIRAEHRAAIDQIDLLFASLQHRAFRGELWRT